MSSEVAKRASGKSSGESGLEAAIIFVMVVVFLGIVFLNTYFSRDGLDDSLAQARTLMHQGDYAAATARLDEVLSHSPAHQEAVALKHDAEKLHEEKLEELRKEREQAARNLAVIAEIGARLAETTTDRDELRGANKALAMNLSTAREKLSNLGSRVDGLQAEAASSQGLLNAAETRITTLDDTSKKLAADLEAAETRAADLSRTLGTHIATLTQELEKSQQAVDTAISDLQAAETRRTSLDSELNKAMQDLEHMRAAHGGLQRSAASAEDEAQALTSRLAEREATISAAMDKLVADGTRSQKAGDHATAMMSYGYALVLDPDNEPARKGLEACKQALEAAEKARREAEEEGKKDDDKKDDDKKDDDF